jgi:uncharacterized ferredoxin-like protein
MALAARTAPKGKGVDIILVRILKDPERKKLADRLAELGNKRGIGFFLRDAKNITAADGCILIGARGRTAVGLDCGACGYETCASMIAACAPQKKSLLPFAGPNCIIRMTDLGIALGSAVKTAQIHNVDNRIMYSGGVAARDLGLFDEDCTVAYAIPLSATGKNIFFDRETGK